MNYKLLKEEVQKLVITKVYGIKENLIYQFKDEVIANVKEWFLKIAGFNHSEADAMIDVSSYIFPNCKDFKSAVLVAKCSYLIFVMDDKAERIPSLAIKYAEIVQDLWNGEDEKNEMTGLEKAFKDFLDDLKKSQTPAQNKRFKESIVKAFTAVSKRQQFLSNPLNLTTEKYMRFRYHDIYAEPWMHLLELSKGVEIEEETLLDSNVKIFLELACYSLFLVNDLYSFRKEFYEGLSDINAVTIAKIENNFTSYQEAIDLIVTKAQEINEKRIEAKNKIIAQKVNMPMEYLIGAEEFIYGTEFCHLMSYRYRKFNE